MGKNSSAAIAKETLSIVENGFYQLPSGDRVDIKTQVKAALDGTLLYRPDELGDLLSTTMAAEPGPDAQASSTIIEVTEEKTTSAALRLMVDEGEPELLALNFASAKNPGGGFKGGAKAQEEDLARASALYDCQVTRREYYDVNRAHESLLYTDYMIYSPGVPFFRNDEYQLLRTPFFPAILTAPAPNAGEVLRHGHGDASDIRETLHRRVGMVLAIALLHKHRCLVLGAWGCGVFRNDPVMVAESFDHWLNHDAFVGVFDRVVFAVYDRGRDQANLRAFRERFAH